MQKTYVIAEIGVNHNGDLGHAKRLVEAAVKCGADAVKFQTFSAEKLATRQAPKAQYQKETTGEDTAQFEMLKSLELSHDNHLVLKAMCEKLGVDFLSSSFHLEATAFLADELKMQAVKFGSGELTNAPLLWDAARRGMDILFSTGMANMEEILIALNFIAQGYDAPDKRPEKRSDQSFQKSVKVQQKVSVFHCTSAYPAAFADLHLNCLKTLKDKLGLRIGFSDHTPGIEAPIAAMAMGAQLIEKHFTLDQSLPGPDHRASLNPQEFAEMVNAIRHIEVSLGTSEKVMREAERNTALVARKQIVAARPIEKGELFSVDNITLKRSGLPGGLSGFEYWNVLGRSAGRDFSEEEIISL